MPKFPVEITYLNIAKEIAKRSYSTRRQVGAVLVKNGNIISYGWNGMPSGMDNHCELEDGTTNPLVIHSESIAILKAARNGTSTDGSSLYITLSPCLDCAKLIIQSGIKEVFYIEQYRDDSPLKLLEKVGIKCTEIAYIK